MSNLRINNRQMAKKTTIKATILIAIFSVFLEISAKTFLNYLIFLAILYLTLIFYIYWKTTQKIEIFDDHITINTPLTTRTVRLSNVIEVFTNRGMMQKRFGLASTYIITKSRNYLLKDLEFNGDLIKKIEEFAREKYVK
jgi:membrane protein YdbS with pleckstrin-like domain